MILLQHQRENFLEAYKLFTDHYLQSLLSSINAFTVFLSAIIIFIHVFVVVLCKDETGLCAMTFLYMCEVTGY